jgi:hypothetical protein
MGATLRYFLLPSDEVALFRLLSRRELTVYPEIVPPGYAAPRADERALDGFTERACYLAAEGLGPVVVRALRKGPDKGMLAIEEVPSPVLHYERSLRNAAGELDAGRLWAELDVTGDPDTRHGKHPGLRTLFEEIHGWLRKSCLRSDPKGWWVGPAAARAWRSEGLVLREAGHKGRVVGVWR